MKKVKLQKNHYEYLKHFHLEESYQKKAELLVFDKGEFICQEGMPYEYLLFVVEGKAKASHMVYNGKKLLQAFYEPGGILGDVELMTEGETTSTVQAISQMRCIGIHIGIYGEVLRQNIKFMNYVGKSLAWKLYQNSFNNTVNTLVTLESRLCSYINAVAEDEMFHENLTEVAELLGTSYRHLMRVLKELCEQEILARNQGIYVVKDMDRLQEMAVDCYVF